MCKKKIRFYFCLKGTYIICICICIIIIIIIICWYYVPTTNSKLKRDRNKLSTKICISSISFIIIRHIYLIHELCKNIKVDVIANIVVGVRIYVPLSQNQKKKKQKNGHDYL
jgi:hypothetical protein